MKKKRFYARFLPLLIPACTVDTPVAEAPAALDDRLGEGLGAWCDSACAKFSSCGLDEEDCPEKCFDSFTTWFIGKGEICAESALRIMDCIDEASCTELLADACNSQDERARCAASQGQLTCESRAAARVDPRRRHHHGERRLRLLHRMVYSDRVSHPTTSTMRTIENVDFFVKEGVRRGTHESKEWW